MFNLVLIIIQEKNAIKLEPRAITINSVYIVFFIIVRKSEPTCYWRMYA